VSNVVHRQTDKTTRCRLIARNNVVHRPEFRTVLIELRTYLAQLLGKNQKPRLREKPLHHTSAPKTSKKKPQHVNDVAFLFR